LPFSLQSISPWLYGMASAQGVSHCAAARKECLRIHCDHHRANRRRVPVWTRYVLVGVWIFFLSMLGAMLFGAYHHFITGIA